MAKPLGKSPTAWRVARILKALSGRTNTGMTAGELAEATGTPNTRMAEILDALIEEGLLVEVFTTSGEKTQRYAHSMEMLQIAYKCIREDKLIQQRLEQKQKTLLEGAAR
ncbi:IclR family transcriptional regulator [Morganella morganii]|uniref:IclR family transcriptional regulator n=1 Tax=Morganella morganii TaxID=582 RepID=A0A8I0PY94_MORMO|nr:helix-turn-helix domain-containing protein [Morganella morganii]MBE8611504.1 IclR family transcriptional regulator [Morganella morganii]